MSVGRVDQAASSDSHLAARIARLAESAYVVLDDRQIEQLVTYLNLLRHWNTAVNLTSLDLEGLPSPALERLILEPLLAATLISTDRGAWYDLGSGGGSPAIPIKVALPGLSLSMVESRGRKVAFLREAVRHMGLSGADVCSVRIEELTGRVEAKSAHLVTARAVRVDSQFVRAIRHLLAPSGEVLMFGAGTEELKAADFTPVRTKGSVTLLRSGVPRGTVGG